MLSRRLEQFEDRATAASLKAATTRSVLERAKAIIRNGCDDGGVEQSMVTGRTRRPDVMVVRHAIMRLIREDTTLSYPAIGALMNRDHTSVMWGVKAAARMPALKAYMKLKAARP